MIQTRDILISATLLPFLSFGCAPPPVSPTVAPLPGLPQVTAAGFQAEVLESTQPVLVEVGVDSACYRCEAMKPRVAEVVRQFEGQAKVVRIDFRAEAVLAQRLGVSVCPTYFVFDEGRVVDSIVGETPTPMLSSKLATAVDRSKSKPPATME